MTGRPNTFVVGAAKAGTTSVCRYLDAHPGAWIPPVKEPHWFASDLGLAADKGIHTDADYLDRYRGADPAATAIVDGSPSSLLSVVAADGIREFDPRARIVVLLRDPIRVIEALHAQLSLGGLQAHPDLDRAVEVAARLEGEPLTGLGWRAWTRYLDVVRFADQLERFQARFPPDQITIVLLDDLRHAPAVTWRALEERLGLDHHDIELVAHNPRRVAARPGLQRLLFNPPRPVATLARRVVPRQLGRRVRAAVWHRNVRPATPQRLAPETERRLRVHLRPQVTALSALVGRDLGRWGQEVPS